MKHCTLLVLFCVFSSGCETNLKTSSGITPLYRPGQELLLTYKTEVTKGDEVDFAWLEMPLLVRAADRKDRVEIHMSIRRIVNGWSSGDKGERWSSDDPDAWNTHGAFMSPSLAEIKSLRFRAILDNRSGKIIHFTGTGKGFDNVLNKIKDAKKRREAEYYLFGSYRSILAESVAYLPQSSSGVGDTWKPMRRDVFPLDAGTCSSLTGDSLFPFLTEESVCQLDDVLDTPGGRIAVIHMTGRRSIPRNRPRILGESWRAESRAKDYYTVTSGDIRFNLDTGQLMSHCIKNTVRATDGRRPQPRDYATEIDNPGDPEERLYMWTEITESEQQNFEVEFVDTLTITPLPE